MKLSIEFVHLARLALAGRRQDVLVYIRRILKKSQETETEILDQLRELLLEAPSIESPLRGGQVAMVPVDQDSRLQLARIEYPSGNIIEPIWRSAIEQRLEQLVNERKHESKLLDADLTPTKSLLLTGPPGVGKSLTAKWLAQKLNRPLVILDLSAVMSSFLGRTGNNLRHVLDYAKSIPCVLLLDEFDAIAKRRDDTGELGELKRLVTVLLQEIDDWPATGLLVAATNHPDLLDPAIWRRFEMVLEFTLPSQYQTTDAIVRFFGEAAKSLESLVPAISTVLSECSYSDIEREIKRIKRESIIREQSLEEGVRALIQSKVASLDPKERKEIAIQLATSGHYSQRQATELTGVSRDTIRLAQRRENGK